MSRLILLAFLLAACSPESQEPPDTPGSTDLAGSTESQEDPVDFLLPPDQLGKPAFEIPSNMLILESNFNSIPNYEPLFDFTNANRYRILGRAIGRLDVLLVNESTGDSGVSFCTTSIISDQYILTNYHCIPGIRPGFKVSRAILRAGFLDDPSATGDVYEVIVEPVEANRELDYAILRVAGNPSAKYGTIPLRVRDPGPGEELFIIHHPKGMTQRLTRRNCRLIASPTAITTTEVRHRCDTFGGSSGSLIFSDNNDGDAFVIVGIHFAGFQDDDVNQYNTAKRMTTVLSQSSVLTNIAANVSAAPKPIATISPPDDNRVSLVHPSAFSTGPELPDDQAPVYTALSRHVTFEWGLKQIYSNSSDGFSSLRDYNQPSDLGDYSSKINLTQYASTPKDNCAVNDKSTVMGANVSVYCNLGRVSNYDTFKQHVRNTLPTLQQTIADDIRGLAVLFSDGTALCLDKRTRSLAASLGVDQLVSLTVWSSATQGAECFSAPSIKLK